ncbi:MAG: carbohydrate kinase [Ignavibacteria bacterium]|nr:carbohydrate kinase [Ignavibacteria bacterium]
MQKFKVTSIGEFLWDIYPDQKRLGGAPFNFIYHIWKLLGTANFISSVGNDPLGNEILAYLNKINFPTKNIHVNKKYPTGIVNVSLNENKIPSFKMKSETCCDYLELDGADINIIEHETDLLYFGTFSQRNETTRDTIQSLFKYNIKYFCDLNLRHSFFTKEMIEKSLSVSNVLKMNEEEFDQLCNIFSLNKNLEDAVYTLMKRFKIELLCITRGENGSTMYDLNSTHEYLAPKAEVIDTLGAGDAFSAVMCIGYLDNWNIEKINKLSNEFAGEICKIKGAVPYDDSLYFSILSKFKN